MNIWTAFFLVVSVVILASPLLFLKSTVTRNGSAYLDKRDELPVPEYSELDLDLASGRVTQEDYEAMTAKAKPLGHLAEGVEENDGNLPEG